MAFDDLNLNEIIREMLRRQYNLNDEQIDQLIKEGKIQIFANNIPIPPMSPFLHNYRKEMAKKLHSPEYDPIGNEKKHEYALETRNCGDSLQITIEIPLDTERITVRSTETDLYIKIISETHPFTHRVILPFRIDAKNRKITINNCIAEIIVPKKNDIIA